MMPEQTQMLMQMMALQFTAIDLNLYLDTHPEDQRALMDYNAIVQELAIIKDQYSRRFGPPISNFGSAPPSQYPWAWVNEPWPWEVTF